MKNDDFKSVSKLLFQPPSLSVHLIICVCLQKLLKFLQWYHKMSLIKVAESVSRVKHMHPGSPSDHWDPWSKVISKYVQSKLNSVFHHFPNVGHKQLCALAQLGCTLLPRIYYFANFSDYLQEEEGWTLFSLLSFSWLFKQCICFQNCTLSHFLKHWFWKNYKNNRFNCQQIATFWWATLHCRNLLNNADKINLE